MIADNSDSGNGDFQTPKAFLKSVSKEAGVPIKDLVVLAGQNDPFNCGGPAQIQQAQWFAKLWHEYMPNGGHIRKLHYKLISQKSGIIKPDRKLYQNTELDWGKLQTYSKFARYLSLVDPLQVIDHRNPEPHIFAPERVVPSMPDWGVDDWFGFDLPYLDTHLHFDFSLPKPYVSGYQYSSGEQPFMIELWVEKSTQDSELIPLCRRLGINLVTSTGFQSVTGSIQALSRAAEAAAAGHAVRIFYLSDFDPAGDAMPVAVSRQLEFWKEIYGNGVDIKLEPLGLTLEQVQKYNLPTTPIKSSDKRQDAFMERYDVDGAVELDALEAIYPGELSRIITEAVNQYRDDDLRYRLEDAESEAEESIESEWQAWISDYEIEAEALEARARKIIKEFEPKIQEISEMFNAAMSDVKKDAQKLESNLQWSIDNFMPEVELPERPEPEIEAPDESNWLFASTRRFGEQLDHYQARKAGGSK